MKPRYNVSRQNRMRARKVEGVDRPVKRKPNTVECPSCGCWVTNPARLHRNSFGGDCKVIPVVDLTVLPPVNLPKRSASDTHPTGSGKGVREWGQCETCGATVSGERRFCGLCLANRMSNRRRS